MDRPNRIAAAAAAVSLPDDALVVILSRVPAKSLCRFKCVSKAWRDLIADRFRCSSRLPQTLEGFFFYVRGGGGGGGDNEDEMHSSADDSDAQGCFINTLGKPSPLASYSFLRKVPGIGEFDLLHSCNGLLLFLHRRVGARFGSLGYIVCNPATEQWVAVPRSGRNEEGEDFDYNCSCFEYLVFNPAVSSHFQLLEFWSDDAVTVEEVYTYSSETGVWCQRTSPWDNEAVSFAAESASVSGMLHLSITRFAGGKIDHELIAVVDGEGKNPSIIRGPEKNAVAVFVGESQGSLHYMNQHSDMTQLSIWVLKDYDTEEWVLKHSVTFLQLFGRVSCEFVVDYSVVVIHPDRNLIFFFQNWDRKLKSYDMDSQEVCTLYTLGVSCGTSILPYVPYYAESSALSSKPPCDFVRYSSNWMLSS